MNEEELLVVMKCGFCFTTVAHSSVTSAVSVDMLRSGMICLQHVLKLNLQMFLMTLFEAETFWQLRGCFPISPVK